MNKTKTISDDWSKLAESLDELKDDWAENDVQSAEKEPLEESSEKKRSTSGRSGKKSPVKKKARTKEKALFEDEKDGSDQENRNSLESSSEEPRKRVKKENVARPKKKVKKSSARSTERVEVEASPVWDLVSQIQKIADGEGDLSIADSDEKPEKKDVKTTKCRDIDENMSLESFFDLDEEPLEIQWGKSPRKEEKPVEKPVKEDRVPKKKSAPKRERVVVEEENEEDEFKKVAEVTDIDSFFADSKDDLVIRWGNKNSGASRPASTEKESVPARGENVKKDRNSSDRERRARPERSDRSARSERAERPERGDRPEQSDRESRPERAVREERSDWKSNRPKNGDQRRREDPQTGEEKSFKEDRRESRRENPRDFRKDDRRENRRENRCDDRDQKRSAPEVVAPSESSDAAAYALAGKTERAFPSWDDAIVNVVKNNMQKHSTRKDNHKRGR